jgi:hypothetical protein
MDKVIEILNSEGPLLAISRERGKFYLMVKEHERNVYTYFPLDKEKLISYLSGNILLTELIPEKTIYSCANEYYTSLPNGLFAKTVEEILREL